MQLKTKTLRFLYAGCFLAFFVSPMTATAQTREKGPWWPNSLWGPNDQAGASNWITPEKILKSIALVKSGQVYELGHVYEREMPMGGQRSYNLIIPSFPTYGPRGDDKLVFNDEFVTGMIGQVGTQFDGPGHVGRQITMADGTTTEVFYNGFTTQEMKNPFGLLKLGIENIKPIITKGILIDIAGFKGVDTLPEGYEVNVEEVRAALRKQGLSENSIEPGDALFFNFGWWRHWPKPITMQGDRPHVNREVIDWIITRKPSMVGSDTILDGPLLDAHTELTMKNGIFNLEWMTFDKIASDKLYTFMFVFVPLPLKGATGSPGRPIAVR